MITFDLIDRCNTLLDSICNNVSNLEPEELQQRIEQVRQLLNKIKPFVLAEFEYDRSNQF